jgi:putative transposase
MTSLFTENMTLLVTDYNHTPAYSSWLNQVEIWFNILSKDVLKGAVWHSKQQLVDQLMEYIKTYNKERAKPFNWTYKLN